MTTRRIAYIIGAGPSEGRGVPAGAISEQFPVDIVQSKAAAVPGDDADLLVTELATVEAAVRAERAGADAVVIGAVADYGLSAVRAAVGIAAVGCGQASLLTAASVATRFSVVTIWPSSTAGQYRSLVDAYNLGTQCVSTRHVSRVEEMATLGEEDNFYTQMRAGREHMIARIVDEMNAAVREDGAEAIVLGCNCMTPVAGVLAERVDVPVIDPTTTGYRFATMLLSLGLAHSRVAFPSSGADRSTLLGQLAAVVEGDLAQRGDDAECEVCVLGDDGVASCETPQPAQAPAA